VAPVVEEPVVEPVAEDKAATTVVEDTPVEPVKEPVKATWPEDWRTHMAGGDEKELERLARFGSPSDVYGSYRKMEAKMSDGSLRADFPADGSDDDKTAWRKANGIPEAAAGYYDALEDGLTIGDDDKPFLDNFFEAAASENMRPREVNKAVSWYFSMQEQAALQRQEVDAQQKQATEDALHAEWGGEYRPNLNAIHGMLDMAPNGVKEILFNSRDAEGVPIFSRPDVVKYMAQLSKDINPTGIPIPDGGTNAIGSMEARVQEITQVMKTNPNQYWGNQAMQDELYKLNAGLARLKPAS